MENTATNKTNLSMDFRARLEAKRRSKQNIKSSPFPDNDGLSFGTFTLLSVEVTEKNSIREIYRNGYYGKGSHSRGSPSLKHNEIADETLVLQLEEAFFLAYFLGILQIRSLDGNEIQWQQYLKEVLILTPAFVENFSAYLYLKSKGWVVKSGLKFGGDFTIYKLGPEYYHASFVVHVIHAKNVDALAHKNLKGMQRVAETSNKDVLLLEVTKPEDFVLKTLVDFENIFISETIVRRLKLSSFVQYPNINK